jgi:hypothetical protein
MKIGAFNIHDYLGKLYEKAEEKDLTVNKEENKVDEEGIIIPENNKKSYEWLKKEFQKGKTEVKVEMTTHEFKPGYNLDTKLKSVNNFKPGMYGEVKTNDSEKTKREKAVPFPETKFPGSETKSPNDNKNNKETNKEPINKNKGEIKAEGVKTKEK